MMIAPARALAVWSGREEQAGRLVGRLREARAVFGAHERRELRDEHALKVVLAATLGSSSNAVDVGANQGAVLKNILRVAPNGRHIAFEPIPELHARLVERFPGVDVRALALSDTNGEREFTHVIDAPALSGLRQRGDLPAGAQRTRRIAVETVRLDDALDDGYVPRLLKIDVEGGERDVLLGGLRTLERHRPFVLFEHGIGGADLYGARPEEVYDLLEGVGLRIFDLEGDGPYSRMRFQEVFTEPLWNFLAAPA